LRIGQNRARKSHAHDDSPDASSRYFAVRVGFIEWHVIDYPDGRIKIRYEGRDLEYREFDKLTPTHIKGKLLVTNA
jgi:hypothetical protein